MILPIRRHDRYVLKAFWGSFGAVLLFFTIIVVILHMSDRLARVVRYWDSMKESGWNPAAVLVEYYATLVPFIWLQIIPLAAVLAAAFALSRLTRHNELSPLVTAGVSTRRITLPVILSGVVLGLFVFAIGEGLVPKLSRRNLSLERLLNEHEPDRIAKVPHFEDPGGARLSSARFRPSARAIEGALLTYRDAVGRPKEVHWYPLIRWDDEKRWVAEQDGTRFLFPVDRATPVRRPIPKSLPVALETDIHLFEVSVIKGASLGLSSSEVGALVEADPDNSRLVLLRHQLYSRCLTPLVMLLFGVPFCLGLGRQSAIPGTLAVLTGGAVFYALTFLTTSLAGGGEFNPIFLAWVPGVIVGSVGLALWLTMES